MKNYTITVNGNVYDVTVEENGSVSAPASAPRKAAPVAAPKAAAPAPAASTGAGSIKIEAGAAGKVFKLEKKVGNEWKELTLVKNEDGTVFSFKGLDDGQYRITETTHPAGYNSIEPIEFTVTANHEIKSDDPALKELAGGDLFTGEVKTGEITGTIVNQKGATLPETGGIGTKMFYVIGAILVVGAAVVMITKKRMSR